MRSFYFGLSSYSRNIMNVRPEVKVVLRRKNDVVSHARLSNLFNKMVRQMIFGRKRTFCPKKNYPVVFVIL